MGSSQSKTIEQPQVGPAAVRDELMAVVYGELRRIAAQYLRNERSDHTLQPTALVHEAYIRLTEQESVNWQGENHFIGVAAMMMRRVLTNYALSHDRQKRGGGLCKIDISQADLTANTTEVDILALDQALSRFEQDYPQESKVVELRFFAGLSIAETASLLNLSESTVKRDFKFARLWLLRELESAKA
jgi:RNA polymerase sigma-70 factor, ECF subfamily